MIEKGDPFGLQNCEVVPDTTLDCVGDENADPDSQEQNEEKEITDVIVVTARRVQGYRRSLRVHLRDVREDEIAFRVTDDGLENVPFQDSQDCSGNVVQNTLSRSQFEGSRSGGHTHPAGYSPSPGPHDGNMAAVTGNGGYIITTTGRSVIERVRRQYHRSTPRRHRADHRKRHRRRDSERLGWERCQGQSGASRAYPRAKARRCWCNPINEGAD